ncbi:hypothetical protein HYO05_23070 [Vibrio parahaemolyticus]|uniref:hypothetical protein n=1 Tax=Vibrio parahaemolyticus TaxID=670 RepID=UPI00084A7096|nr:hypothetical protein [Vibrio parahaemolyticus]EGQ8047249.1 hypothetical protein [Vibrio parahaemolyticus]EHH2867135.1 hypothetical protein [Vibrio parahaemolyticus]ELA9316692.1 hypothetical protein [Vibrio parahaemolyticus]MBM5036976.1 hypothetical protein [Vibrio parahaemolyticus]MBM5050649.1 hypothetical protein [Vibrio parahaemolyticus]
MAEESLGTKVTNLAVAVLTIVASLYGGYVFIESKFEEFVAKKLEPYQQLLIAQSIDNDGAIVEYQKSLKTMLDDKVTSEMLTAVVTPYLTSIANSDKPYKYQHHTESIRKLIGTKLPMDYNMANSFGWIYLSTNDVEKSREYFQLSLSLYKQADLLELSSNTFDGLMLTYLISGDMEQAIANYNNTWKYDYSGYNPNTYYSSGFKEYQWAQRLFALYPSLKGNYQKLLDYLKVTYELGEQIKPKEINKEVIEAL